MTQQHLDISDQAGAIFAPVEFKFAKTGEPGVFEGYGSVFGGVDSHGDIVQRGAFAQSLAEHKAAGSTPGMYAEHSAYVGGDPLPVGAWQSIVEDSHGLRVKGKISGLDTDHGKRVLGLMKDGALRGLSIAFHVPQGGSIANPDPAVKARRVLTRVNLESIDIVRSPSNKAAKIAQIKTFVDQNDYERFLRSNGIARAAAERLAAGGWPCLTGEDDDDEENQAIARANQEAIDRLARKFAATAQAIKNLNPKDH
jgi:HK97 family phage prohead protease